MCLFVCERFIKVFFDLKLSAKLPSTAINILPKNIINLTLSNVSLSTATSEAHVCPEVFMDEQTRHNSKTDNSITRKIQLDK